MLRIEMVKFFIERVGGSLQLEIHFNLIDIKFTRSLVP